MAHLSKHRPDPVESALVLPLKVEAPDLNGYCMLVGSVVRAKSDSVATEKDENDVDLQNSFQQEQQSSLLVLEQLAARQITANARDQLVGPLVEFIQLHLTSEKVLVCIFAILRNLARHESMAAYMIRTRCIHHAMCVCASRATLLVQ